jgi:serine/threonine protein kinase
LKFIENKNGPANEVEILRSLNHPHIIKMVDSSVLQDYTVILMEHCETNLQKLLDQGTEERKKKPIPLIKILYDLTDALAYLHSK